MCRFDPAFTPNLTDFSGRRYCYRNQPEACQWNCIMLANALFSAGLVGKEEAEEVLGQFAEVRTGGQYSGRYSGQTLLR